MGRKRVPAGKRAKARTISMQPAMWDQLEELQEEMEKKTGLALDRSKTIQRLITQAHEEMVAE